MGYSRAQLEEDLKAINEKRHLVRTLMLDNTINPWDGRDILKALDELERKANLRIGAMAAEWVLKQRDRNYKAQTENRANRGRTILTQIERQNAKTAADVRLQDERHDKS